MHTDEQLQKDVMDELKWEPMLEAAQIGVAAHNGVITLSGNVNSYNKKLAAEDAAKRVKGVRSVAIDIEVHLSGDGHCSDTEIANAVVSALKWNTTVPDEQIISEVDNGYVTLEGEVAWQFQKDAAVNAIKHLVGIKGITNLITLKPAINTGVVKDNIRKALERNADISADRITIAAEGSRVILRGKARSWNERQIAEHAAWSSPGVLAVKDELVIAD